MTALDTLRNFLALTAARPPQAIALSTSAATGEAQAVTYGDLRRVVDDVRVETLVQLAEDLDRHGLREAAIIARSLAQAVGDLRSVGAL